MYNYYDAVTEDVKNYIYGTYTEEELKELLIEDRDSLEETLNDDLWIDDSVTGNASGSYTCNSNVAKECVLDNIDLLNEVVREYGIDETEIGMYFLNEEWKYFDVSIRCYVLGSCIGGALDDFEIELEV